MAFNTDNIGKNCYINISEDENIENSLYGTIIGYYQDSNKNEEYYFVSINGNVIKIYDDSLVNIIEDSGGGGGSGTDTNAVHYTADTDKTEEQKAQARTNIGAVSIDEIGTVFKLKGSVDTVNDLPVTGNSIGDVYYVKSVSAGYIWMTSTTYPSGYWEKLGETIDLSAYQLKPITITISDTVAVIEPEDNHVYNCGELANLKIIGAPSSGSYSIVFTSGASPTVTSIPSTILGLENFAPEANTTYEINVLDNRAVIGSWEVTA